MTERLGGALAIREHWCRPGERILRCIQTQYRVFDVPGLDSRGEPPPTIREKAKVGAVGALVFGAALAFGGDGDNNGDEHSADPNRVVVPDMYVVGADSDCRAVEIVRQLPDRKGWWVFTPARIGWLAEVPSFLEEKAPLLNVAVGFGKLFVDAAKSFTTDTGLLKYQPGKAIEIAPMECHIELPPSDIARVTTVFRGTPNPNTNRPYVRIEFHDGSGLEFNTVLGLTESMLTSDHR
ncbi:hypothetical protein [Allokutzneria albata]|uniref:Uncharacterized protein n=1 Tax=Allokutzneria albata TaxID=211114 RepID=A0A1G9ZB68_ALLAB|nr:hypothetical protein [Allokutzneria albata]SDN18365.1 hypothetical protein SAMN04489726_5380 [Allokutzneria albata]